MRIIEIETFGSGGLAHYAYNLSCALVERGHEVTLVTASRYELEEDRPLPARLKLIRKIGRRTGHGEGSSLGRKLEAIFDAFAVARLCREIGADLVHLHCTNPIALLYVERLCRLELPVVYTAHSLTPHETIPLEGRIYGRLHDRCDHVIAHSQVDRQRLLDEFGLSSDRVSVIPHGEYGFFAPEGRPRDTRELRSELGIARDAPVALLFGYIREYKGLDVLLDAWPAVAAAVPDARLLVVGDPVRLPAARREELRQWAESLDAVCRFEYVPFEDVHRYVAAADILVLPYRKISQSGVLYLALSLGLPVVATRVGAFPELLEDGVSARLVEPEDPEALASALAETLGDAELRSRLAAGGLRVAAKHSWPAIAERTEELFTRLTDGRS